MTIPQKARRIGLQELIKVLRRACKIITPYGASMKAFIDSVEDLSDSQKTLCKAAIDSVVTSCHVLEELRRFYEP